MGIGPHHCRLTEKTMKCASISSVIILKPTEYLIVLSHRGRTVLQNLFVLYAFLG